MLQLTNLLKKYESQIILNIPNFALQQGIYWLKGANGSGKSTLLKIIAGLIPSEGNICWNNINLHKQPVAYKHCISYHPADAALPSFITGLELIEYYNAIRNKQHNEIEYIVETFQLSAYVKNPIGTYSSGMQKRLSLALAFIGNTQLILLDEPLSTLDVETTQLIASSIAKQCEKGSSFIITSHQDFEYKNVNFTKELLIVNQTITVV
jgi:ABC-2 type transport system ATP-binding protein